MSLFVFYRNRLYTRHQNVYARVYGLFLKYVLEVYNFASAISSLKMCGCLGHFPSLLDTIQVLTTQFVLYAVALAFKTYYWEVSSTTVCSIFHSKAWISVLETRRNLGTYLISKVSNL